MRKVFRVVIDHQPRYGEKEIRNQRCFGVATASSMVPNHQTSDHQSHAPRNQS